MKKPGLIQKIIVMAMAMACSVLSAIAADRYSVATGNWNNVATWSATSGGAPGATVPVAGDNVFIEGGFTVTITANAACANLSVANGSTLTIGAVTLTASGTTALSGTINFTSTSGTKTFTGSVTINATGIWNNNTVNEQINFRGGVSNSGTFNAGTAVYTFNTNNQALTGTLSIPRVTVTGVTLTNNGTLTVSAALAGNGGLTQAVNSTLDLGGTSAITTLTATNSGNTVIFSGANQIAKVSSYYNLTLSGTGTKTFATTPTVNAMLSMEGTATIVVTAGVVTYGLNATLSYNTATPRTTSSEEWIVPFAATGGVIIANTGTITTNVGKVLSASVPLTINSGATLATNNLQLTLGGDFVNGGSLSAGSSPIVITNTMGSQSIDGFTTTGLVLLSKTAGTATFAGNVNGGGLTINGAGGTLNLGSGLTHTFTGGWTMTDGTLNGGSSFLMIGGNASGTGGTFTAGSGTVEWYAGGAQTCAGVTYNNLTLSGSGAKTVTGATVNGILSMEGTATAAGTTPIYGAASTLQYKGSAAQTTGIEIPAALNNLTVNNSSGITLTGNVTVGGILTMTLGNISTGVNSLILSNSTVGALNHVSGTVIGKLGRAVNTPLSNDYLFPVGTVAYYRPAVMNFSSLSTGTEITAEFISTAPAGFTGYNDNTVYLRDLFSEGYWRFSSTGIPVATYTLELTADGFTSYTIDGFTRITGRDNANPEWRAAGIHGTQSGNDVSRVSVTTFNTTSFDFALATGCNASYNGYETERNITIDHTKVAGGTDLYNFPVLISLAGQNFLKSSPAGQVFNVNGYDIIFTDNNYNKLDHQLEYYSGINGDLIAWVRIPTLSVSSNTVIKILYGNPAINTDPSVTAVWDTHYKGVWHLDNNSLQDFTYINKSGTPYNSPTYPAGTIENSLGLNGTNQYVEVINDPEINFAGNVTVSAWVYMNNGGRDQKIAGNQNNSSGGYKFGIYTNNKVEFEIRNSANTPSLNRDVAGGTVLNTGQWYYLAGISSDVLDSIKTFVNGNPERPFKKIGILGTASNNLIIGREPFQSSYFFSGRFDELRISNRARSNGWMKTEYNNQSSPSTFFTLDADGVVSDNLPSEGLCNAPFTLSSGYPIGGTYSGNPYIAGNVFTPPAAGTYPVTYTYDAGCGPVSVTRDMIITGIPAAPVASDKEYCTNQITYLEATSGLNIRWYDGGTMVSTANPYSTGQTAAGIYNYTVTQTVNGCESTAADVSLTIFNGITLNAQPQPVSVCGNGIAIFSVGASGYNLSYRWQEDGVNISDGGIYSGALTSMLTLTNPGISKNGKQYRCVISTSCGASPVTSNAAALTIITDLAWTGAVSSDWNVAGNWSCGFIPILTTVVQIPDVPDKPVLGPGTIATVNNLTIEPGSSLTISGNTIQISGSITNNGTFIATDGTIEMNGTAAQSIGTGIFAGNTIKELIVNNTAGVSLLGPLNVSGIALVQNGNLSTGGNLTLLSTAVQTSLINGSGAGTVTGNVTMERYLPSAFGYKYLSSPFQAATVSELGDDIDLMNWFPPLFRYNEASISSGWVDYVTPSDLLNPLQGYAANFGNTATPFTADISGVVNNGPVSITLYNNNNIYTEGFNLVGNPYPSPIDWDAISGWTKTNIDNALYYFKASTIDEYGGTYSTYINGISSDGLATNIVPSMQGFFIHVFDGSYPVTGILGLDNNVRVTDLTHPFLKSEGDATLQLVRLGATFTDDTTSTDPVVIYFDDKAQSGFDSYLDALKLMNTDGLVPNLFAFGTDGKKLSIDALPENRDTLYTVPLGLKTEKNGFVVFRIVNGAEGLPEMKINISDLVSGSENDLLDKKEYIVYLEAGEYNNRFFLNLTDKGPEIPDTSNVFTVYSSNGIVKAHINIEKSVSGQISIYNLAGQVIFVEKIFGPGYYEFNPVNKDGIYIINFVSGKFRDSKKLFIQGR